MKVVKSSLVAGAVVTLLSFAAAAYGGPVVWAGYWLAVCATLSRA